MKYLYNDKILSCNSFDSSQKYSLKLFFLPLDMKLFNII